MPRENKMRLLTASLPVIVLSSLLAACGGRPYLMYPDTTNWFYPEQDIPLRSDLSVKRISCGLRPDGTLTLTADVDNLGADIIARKELLTGDMAAFRISARFTGADGSSEVVDGVQFAAMTVTDSTSIAVRRVRMPIDSIVRIDVIADPDRVVPDPQRQNNSLSWSGKLNPTAPVCTITRT